VALANLQLIIGLKSVVSQKGSLHTVSLESETVSRNSLAVLILGPIRQRVCIDYCIIRYLHSGLFTPQNVYLHVCVLWMFRLGVASFAIHEATLLVLFYEFHFKRKSLKVEGAIRDQSHNAAILTFCTNR